MELGPLPRSEICWIFLVSVWLKLVGPSRPCENVFNRDAQLRNILIPIPFFLLLFLSSRHVKAQAVPSEICLQAKDYVGCMEYQSHEEEKRGAPLVNEVGAFDAKNMKDKDCKVLLFSNGIDICGTEIRRRGIVNYSMVTTVRCDGWGRYCATRIFKFDFGFEGRVGREAAQFYMLNERVARDMNQRFTSWTGGRLQQIDRYVP